MQRQRGATHHFLEKNEENETFFMNPRSEQGVSIFSKPSFSHLDILVETLTGLDLSGLIVISLFLLFIFCLLRLKHFYYLKKVSFSSLSVIYL